MQSDSPRLWAQFRRLLLGTAVELFADVGLRVDTRALELSFEEDRSLFRYPSLHSEMRFVGSVHGFLLEQPDEATLLRFEEALMAVWPEIVELVRLPMLGSMVVVHNEVSVLVEPNRSKITVRFDLAAA